MLRTLIYFHVYIILDFSITYRNASVLCQSECACRHYTVNMVVFLVKNNENTYPKGRALVQMYRVVPITKRGKTKVWDNHWRNSSPCLVNMLFVVVSFATRHAPLWFDGTTLDLIRIGESLIMMISPSVCSGSIGFVAKCIRRYIRSREIMSGVWWYDWRVLICSWSP